MFDSSASPLNTGSNNDVLPEGHHTKAELISAKMGVGQVSKRPYVSFKVRILESDNPAAVGQVGDVFEQLTGAKFPSYDTQAQGRVLAFVGTLFGLSPSGAAGKVGAKEVAAVCADDQPMTGRVVSFRAKKVAVTSKGDDILRTSDHKPVLVDGQPMEVSGLRSVGAPAPAVPPPVAPKAEKTLPPNWTVHPSDPNYAYNGNQVKLISEL